MTSIDDLPIPTKDDLIRSERLSSHIVEVMREQDQQTLSFADFMTQALYHPTLGYYMQADFSIGRDGDFITAPHLSPLFAHCIAEQLQETLKAIGTNDVLELGAGTGQLAGDLLTQLDQHHRLNINYYIYEISPMLRLKQKQFITQHFPQYLKKIIWLQQLPTSFSGIIIANEVLDAIPVHRFTIQNTKIYEQGVAYDEDQFVWRLKDANSTLLEKVRVYQERYCLPEGYTSEYHINLRSYVNAIVSCLHQGLIFFIDYGYGEAEYYHSERGNGSLTCFYHHRHHSNPFIYPGLQDITSHVNFTEVIDAAFDAGCKLSGYTTQAAFLLASRLLDHADVLQANANAIESFNIQQDIKKLTLPTEMGERIKIMALSKNKDLKLSNFKFADRRRDL